MILIMCTDIPLVPLQLSLYRINDSRSLTSFTCQLLWGFRTKVIMFPNGTLSPSYPACWSLIGGQLSGVFESHSFPAGRSTLPLITYSSPKARGNTASRLFYLASCRSLPSLLLLLLLLTRFSSLLLYLPTCLSSSSSIASLPSPGRVRLQHPLFYCLEPRKEFGSLCLLLP